MRHRLWVVFLALAVQFVFGATSLQAFIVQPDFTIASSPNPVGSGARAVGMGGAFIAIADDATAASWNPAGLIQLERPEISIVGDYINRTADYTSATNPVVNTGSTTRESNLNYFSASYPFNALNRNMVVSLNYQRLYDFDYNLDYRFEATVPLGGPLFVTTEQDIHYTQEGTLGPLGLAYTVEITPRVSVGFTLNIWSDDLGYDNSWKETMQAHVETVVTGGPPIPPSITDITIIDEYSDFSGWNANFGVLSILDHRCRYQNAVYRRYSSQAHTAGQSGGKF
jgi:long-subunit fatty acid transport protein